MRPINIFALTRIAGTERLERLERQLSGRRHFLKIKEWELDSLQALCEAMCRISDRTADMKFYFSFCLPKLGKEFDLLRIGKKSVMNIELKSEAISDEAIKKQLLLNRYYLSMLGLAIYSFTYTSSTGRLVRLSHGGRLLDVSLESLVDILTGQEDCFEDDIEDLFRENQFLISPLTDTERFLRRDYFLTSQQRDIERKILKTITAFRDSRKRGERLPCPVLGFTGLPGTGKTILLYDLAMQLSGSRPVCMFHFGAYPEGIRQLARRLKRIDFYNRKDNEGILLDKEYQAIFVDEGHRIDEPALSRLYDFSVQKHIPMILSYDSEMPIAPQERKKQSTGSIESLPGFLKYKLTNRIRLNNEMSMFIQILMHITKNNPVREYPNVALVYAKNAGEAALLTRDLIQSGYTFLYDAAEDSIPQKPASAIDIAMATSREFDRVAMIVGPSFYYDDEGYLRCLPQKQGGQVRHLYHGLNRARKKVSLIVMDNLPVFDRVLGVLQRR